MKKILLSLAVAVIAMCAGAQNYHAITDGEVASCSQANIEACDWIDYTKTNYSTRSKCVEAGETIPNLSSTDRIVSFTVSGCASFEVTAEGNKEVRSLAIGVNGTTIATQEWANGCNTYGPFETGTTGECTITVGGTGASVYLSSVTFYAPAAPSLEGFTVGGEEMTINNTDMTVTGTVSADVDLSTTQPVVTIGGSATDYNFDGNYNGGTLTVTDGTTILTYTVTVTNRELDVTPPMPTGIYCEGVDLMMGTPAGVDKTINITFTEPIILVDTAMVNVYGVKFDENYDIIAEGFCECEISVEDNNLYITPSPRFDSGFMYTVTFSGAVTDIDGNLYFDDFGLGLQFITEEVALTVADATPASDDYIHALKMTFSTEVVMQDGIMLNVADPDFPMPNMQTAANVEILGNNLYILDVANVMPGSIVSYSVLTTSVRGVYYDMLAEAEGWEGTGMALISDDVVLGDNSFRIGFNAPINDTYIMPSWIEGTAGVSVDRDYAGSDMPAGAVGAIRAGKTDSLIVDVPQGCNIKFTVSATGGRTFVVTNEAGEELANVPVDKSNTITDIPVDINEAGKIYLYTPGATGGFTVQAMAVSVHSGMEGIEAEKESSVSYANRVILNNGAKVEVYNLSGVCVARSESNIDMSRMPKGIYIVRINDKESMKIVR